MKSTAALMGRLHSQGFRSPLLERRILALAVHSERLAARTLLQSEDDPVRRPRYLLSGWACRFRLLSDGRRQVLDILLPGDGVGLRASPLARAGVVALTRLETVDAEGLFAPASLQAYPELVDVLRASADTEEQRMMDHIVRLGRLTALERLGHLLLNLYDRLAVVGRAAEGRYVMPLTQEVLADSLGLSVVHVNRTLQALRRMGLVRHDRGEVWLPDLRALQALVGYEPPVRPINRPQPSSPSVWTVEGSTPASA